MKFLSWLDTHKKYIKIACAIVIGLNCLLAADSYMQWNASRKFDEYDFFKICSKERYDPYRINCSENSKFIGLNESDDAVDSNNKCDTSFWKEHFENSKRLNPEIIEFIKNSRLDGEADAEKLIKITNKKKWKKLTSKEKKFFKKCVSDAADHITECINENKRIRHKAREEFNQEWERQRKLEKARENMRRAHENEIIERWGQ